MVSKVESQRDQKPRCRTCKKRAAVSRGNCATCLSNAHNLIRSGERTEQELVDKGILLPAKKPGRPRNNAVRSRLEKIEAVSRSSK